MKTLRVTAVVWLLAAICATGCSMLAYKTQEPLVQEEAYSITSDGEVVLDLGRVPSLGAVGGAATIEDDRLPSFLIIARPEPDRYVVASSRCTHGNRALGYEHDAGRFRCSSFGSSEYNLEGTVLSGPAPHSLRIYETQEDGGRLVIKVGE